MTLSLYDMTVPVYTRMLKNLIVFLDRAEADANKRKYALDNVLPDARLAPDMLPFRAQIMIATDHVKGSVSRLTGRPIPSWPDEETTFAELRTRIEKALDLLKEFDRTAFDGAETRPVTLTLGGKEVSMEGLEYLTQRALPNFYFHVTTAYAILRHNGVELGKRDFIG